MLRDRPLVVAVATVFGACAMAWVDGLLPYFGIGSPIVFGPAVPLVVMAVALIVRACNRNFYELKYGTVVGRRFRGAQVIPAHWTFPYAARSVVLPTDFVPDRTVPSVLWLKLKGPTGRTGWVRLDGCLISQYPMGSWYPDASGIEA